MTNQLDTESILRDLPVQLVGRAVQCYAQVGSTNDLARQQARAGTPEGLAILAEEQTAGRGRLGRGWAAPPGSSLLMSLLLRPTWLAPSDAFALTMLAGVALCEAIEQATAVPAALKWPNDLLLPDSTAKGAALRKAAGVLSEIELDHNAIAWVVIGIGVNVNWRPQGVIDGRDLGALATSLSAAAGRSLDRLALLRALLQRLDQRYAQLRQGQRSELFDAWASRLATLGQAVQISLPQGQLGGVAESVAPSGALLVRDSMGALHTVLAGDVGS